MQRFRVPIFLFVFEFMYEHDFFSIFNFSLHCKRILIFRLMKEKKDNKICVSNMYQQVIFVSKKLVFKKVGFIISIYK